MANTTTTFIGYIANHKIQIPLIQRDYVQGTAKDDVSKEKRNDFVNKLLGALYRPGCYTLDFIYGAPESYDDKTQADDSFLPLDGQQRLTTLFLLHWALAVKNNTDRKYDYILTILKNFSYKTRISSDKFCRKLLDTSFDENAPLVDQIKDKSWFTSDIQLDPTVQSMMDMLQQIETALSEEPFSTHIGEMADKLFDAAHCPIVFSILNMQTYQLTDGLYVKMNARGKELTSFENWKADFISLISDDPALKEQFTEWIEHDWSDLFWKGVYAEYEKDVNAQKSEEEKKRVPYPRIDEHFMNFFINMSRLLFFIETKTNKPNADDYNGRLWSTAEALYSSEHAEYRERLFSLLNKLSEINKEGNGLDAFFNDLFCINELSDWGIDSKCVRLFGCKDTNIFKAAYESDEFDGLHVILYAILSYCIKHKINSVNDDLRAFTRVFRNYLYQHNYLDSAKIVISSQVRATEMKEYDKVITYLIENTNVWDSLRNDYQDAGSKYVETERKKTMYWESTNPDISKLLRKIEDMTYTHGNVGAFDSVLEACKDDRLSCATTWEAICAFHEASPLEKIQLFLVYDYKGIEIGNDCIYGKRIFMGSEYNNKHWDVHFRAPETKLNEWLYKYVMAYRETPTIKNLIHNEVDKIKAKPTTIRDYMLKYPKVVAAQKQMNGDDNTAPYYYAMPRPWQDMDVIVIHSYSMHPLGNSYQTCPMACAVAHEMNHYDKSHMTYEGHGATKYGVIIHQGDWDHILFQLYFGTDNWYIKQEHFGILSPQLQQKFERCSDKTSDYYLKNDPNLDLIKHAAQVMDDVVNEFKNRNLI